MTELYQLIGDNGVEELWEFLEGSEDAIKGYYEEYTNSDYDDFEQFMQEMHIDVPAGRKFVTEIYV